MLTWHNAAKAAKSDANSWDKKNLHFPVSPQFW